MPQARVAVREILITPTDPAAPTLLVVQIEIDCPHCGYVELQFFGHHLTTLAKELERIKQKYPELAGEAGTAVGGTQWSGTPSADPSRN